MSLLAKLQPLRSRYEELAALMGSGNLAGDQFQKLGKEYSDLGPIIEAIDEYEKALRDREGAHSLMSDPDLKHEAEAEYVLLGKKIPDLEDKIRKSLIPKDDADTKNAILEIRAGTGGDEAALFAADLFGMYRGYAAAKGWRFEILDVSESDLGGYKEVSVEVSGHDVFSRLKFESGVHRVQRVPKTETGGRVHTSAATVAVLPEAEDVDIVINDADLRIDTYRSSGAGGQHVNKTDSAIRITHMPTGIVVAMQEERSQHKNRAKAMKLLRSRIYEQKWVKLQNERAADRKSQVGSGDRSERIRTYNYPQGRVTDHRVNVTLYNLAELIKGIGLDDIIEALITEDQAEKLSALDL